MAASGASSLEDPVYLLVIHWNTGDKYRIFPSRNGLEKATAPLDDDIKRGRSGLNGYTILDGKDIKWEPHMGPPAQARIV